MQGKRNVQKKINNSILSKFYVDDYLDFADLEEKAMEKKLEIIRVHRLDRFDVVNWKQEKDWLDEIKNVVNKKFEICQATNCKLGWLIHGSSYLLRLMFTMLLHSTSRTRMQGKRNVQKKINISILSKFHVDDYLNFADSKEKAMEKNLEIIRVQRLDEFEVVNWVSNSSKIMGEPGKDLEDEKCFNDNPLSTEQILGVWWD
ncbi:hypothetical protein JTB14_002069 [Gonioctena quinquepunctata]|nr:hypothetical protein JTB14_002069 [Gonioctena quinquepunctata]